MAVTYTNRTNTVGYGARIVAVFDSAVASYLAWKDRRATRKMLTALSDRELDDIGLSRGDILNMSR